MELGAKMAGTARGCYGLSRKSSLTMALDRLQYWRGFRGIFWPRGAQNGGLRLVMLGKSRKNMIMKDSYLAKTDQLCCSSEVEPVGQDDADKTEGRGMR